jgi:hypothetical protein
MAKTAAHSHYLLSVDAGETCAHLYLIVPKTMLVEDEDYLRLAFETNFTLADALLSAGYAGPPPPSPTVSRLERESQDAVEATLRGHLAHGEQIGEQIDEFKAGKRPMLKVALVSSADNPCCAALMALHHTRQ